MPNESVSVKQLLHYLQLLQQPEFTQYDYGNAQENRYRYEKDSIPVIPLENIYGVPIVMLVGEDDTWAKPEDA